MYSDILKKQSKLLNYSKSKYIYTTKTSTFASIIITYWLVVCYPTFAEIAKLPGHRFPVLRPGEKKQLN